MKSPTLITVAPSEIAPFRGDPAPSNKQAEIAARRLAMADPVPDMGAGSLSEWAERYKRGWYESTRHLQNMSAVKICALYAGQRYDEYHGREPTHGAACMPGKQPVAAWGASALGDA